MLESEKHFDGIPFTVYERVSIDFAVNETHFAFEVWVLDDHFWIHSGRPEALAQMVPLEEVKNLGQEDMIRWPDKSLFVVFIKKSVYDFASDLDRYNLYTHEFGHFYLKHFRDSTPDMEREVDGFCGKEVEEANHLFGIRYIASRRNEQIISAVARQGKGLMSSL